MDAEERRTKIMAELTKPQNWKPDFSQIAYRAGVAENTVRRLHSSLMQKDKLSIIILEKGL